MTVIRFGEKGLLPAVVQDYETHELLMVAYMNKESLTPVSYTHLTLPTSDLV